MSNEKIANQLQSNTDECQECKNYVQPSISQHIQSLCLAGNKFDLRYGFKKNLEANLKYWNVWAHSGKQYVKNNLNKPKTGDYHSIIIVNYGFLKNLTTFASGIDLLIDYFKKNSIQYKVSIYDNFESFEREIRCQNAQYLWIFGHGDRHGVSFGKGKYFPYCKLKNAPKKQFIAQLHCSNGEGKALWEFISTNPGIFSNDYRYHLQNREDIKKYIKKNDENKF